MRTTTHTHSLHRPSRRTFLRLGAAAAASMTAGLPVLRAGAQGKINLVYMSSELTSVAVGPEIKRQLADFEKSNPGITVEAVPVPLAQYQAKIVAAAKAGEMPDLCHIDFLWMQSWIQAGYLRDHTPFIEKAGGKAFLDGFYQNLIQIATHDGKLYGVPAFGGGYMLYYNTELFKAAGLDPNRPPTNWDELLEYAKKLTKKDAAGNTIQWGYGIHGQNIPADVSRFLQWMYSNGADPLSPDNKKAQLDQPKAIEALRFWSELYTKHAVVPPGSIQNGPGEVRSLFAQKKIAMQMGILWGLDQIFAENPAMRTATMVAPFPKQVSTAPSLFQMSYNSIGATSKHPAEAFKVLEHWSRPENALALYRATRYGPVQPSLFARPEVKSDPFAQVLAKINERLKPPPLIPQWERASKVIGDAMQRALTGAKAPDVAFKEANAQVNQILQ
jgi:ABC-type glycerol-3-phosphate transport system substrate-binding protein